MQIRWFKTLSVSMVGFSDVKGIAGSSTMGYEVNADPGADPDLLVLRYEMKVGQ
jgi:hypothetical protein